MSEEALRDKVVVSDASEREGDVDRSSDAESELRDIMGWGWYKREKGTQDGGGGFGIRMVRGEGNRGAKKMSDVRRGWWVGLWGGERAEMGWPRKRGGEPGLFVALLRGDVELLSLWSRGGRKKW